MIDLEKNKINTLNRITENLNLDPIKKGSYLYTLVDGLYRVGEDVANELYTDILNTRIDTADEATLDVFGAYLGLPRLTNKYGSFSKWREDLKIEVEYHRESNGLPVTLYGKNETIETEEYSLTFYEDLIYDPTSIINYASCFIKPLFSIHKNSSLEEGTHLSLEVPRHLKDDIKYINLVVLSPKYFNKAEESVLDYRKRLIGALENRNISGSTAIDKALRSIPGIYDYYIDRHSIPQKIYCLNYDMYSDPTEDIVIEQDTIPVVDRVLDQVKPYNTNFEVLSAIPINLHFVIETNSPDVDRALVLDAINLLFIDHRVSEPFRLNKRYIDAILLLKGLEIEYNLKVYYDYKGYRELAEDVDSVLIERGEFPRILSVDIVPLQERSYV